MDVHKFSSAVRTSLYLNVEPEYIVQFAFLDICYNYLHYSISLSFYSTELYIYAIICYTIYYQLYVNIKWPVSWLVNQYLLNCCGVFVCALCFISYMLSRHYYVL